MKPRIVLAGLVCGVLSAASPALAAGPMERAFELCDELAGWERTAGVAIDAERNREGSAGGSLLVGPGAKAVWPLRVSTKVRLRRFITSLTWPASISSWRRALISGAVAASRRPDRLTTVTSPRVRMLSIKAAPHATVGPHN